MAKRRQFSAKYKREAVAMLQAPDVRVSQVAAELGIGVNMLGRWRREWREEQDTAFQDNGRPRDEELAALRHHVLCSVRAVGTCADNAVAESFFGVLKRERVNGRHYRTRAKARADIFDYMSVGIIRDNGGDWKSRNSRSDS